MDFIDHLNKWMPTITAVAFFVWAIIHVLIMSTFATKKDLAAARTKSHADHDALNGKIADLDRRQAVSETAIGRIEAGQHEIATKGDLAAILRSLDDLKADVTRVETYLLNSKADKK